MPVHAGDFIFDGLVTHPLLLVCEIRRAEVDLDFGRMAGLSGDPVVLFEDEGELVEDGDFFGVFVERLADPESDLLEKAFKLGDELVDEGGSLGDSLVLIDDDNLRFLEGTPWIGGRMERYG